MTGTSLQGPPVPGYSGSLLALVAAGALVIGAIFGAGATVLLRPVPPGPEALAQPGAGGAAAEVATALPTDDVVVPPEPARPAVDPAVAARARRLAELRKKVKSSRAKQMDAQCRKNYAKRLPAGYVFKGGRFEENAFVANARGCVSLAKTAKAPWFCCAK